MHQSIASRAVLALFVVLGLVGGAIAAANPEARFDEATGKLTVHAKEASAGDVLRAITKATEVRFMIDPELAAKKISIDLEGMKLERALQTLVAEIPDAAGTGFAYKGKSGRDARLSTVRVFTVGKGDSALASLSESDTMTPAGDESESASTASVLPEDFHERIHDGLDMAALTPEDGQTIAARAAEVSEEILGRPSPVIDWGAMPGGVPTDIAPGAEGVMPFLEPHVAAARAQALGEVPAVPDAPPVVSGPSRGANDPNRFVNSALAPEAADVIERISEARAAAAGM